MSDVVWAPIVIGSTSGSTRGNVDLHSLQRVIADASGLHQRHVCHTDVKWQRTFIF